MRVVPVLSRKLLQASSSEGAVLVFVTITHPLTLDVIRLVMSPVDHVLDGITFNKSWFNLNMLTDSERPPQAQFSFPNVDRQAMNLMRTIVGPPRVAFELYTSNFWEKTGDPRDEIDPLETAPLYTARSLYLTAVKITPAQVTGTLRSWDYSQERWPNKAVTKSLLPGVYVR